MFRKSMKLLFFVLLAFVIVVVGDNETRDALKGKINAFKQSRT